MATATIESSDCAEPGISRVLIFLLGSLGDALVALPSLHLIRRRFPQAQRRVLANAVDSAKAVALTSLLDGSKLVDDYYIFPSRSPDGGRLRSMLSLGREIRHWKPEVLVYLHEQRGFGIALRDAVIFRALGISRLVGVPLSGSLRRPVLDASRNFESRPHYLRRALAPLGDPRLSDRASWDLLITAKERARARQAIDSLQGCAGILCMSIGTKIDANDWGDAKWSKLLAALGTKLPGWGLIALGAAVERERSSALLAHWKGRSVNLAGQLTVRESGAVLQACRAYIGHDSGPMHLAAAVGTPCVAIFSARNLPGRWFPFGDNHHVFYKRTECAGCGLFHCVEQRKKCIDAITVDEVAGAVLATTFAQMTGT
jgi:ADP-heptose:LPS heptosyltransferase